MKYPREQNFDSAQTRKKGPRTTDPSDAGLRRKELIVWLNLGHIQPEGSPTPLRVA